MTETTQKKATGHVPVADGAAPVEAAAPAEIPVVDIGPLLDGSDPMTPARQIHAAFRDVGFMYIKNHGISEAERQGMLDRAAEFFALPDAVKQALHIERSGRTLRGYIPLSAENLDPGVNVDLKEAYDLGAEEPDADLPFFGANPWPEGWEDGKREVLAYHDKMVRLTRQLFRGVALGLGLDADHFAPILRHPITVLRLQHYPPQEPDPEPGTTGCGAHTDYGSLTILGQDGIGGLQVRAKSGAWIDVPPLPGTFIVNIGDLMEVLTNGIYTATLHRVINTHGLRRYSYPFFIDSDYDALIEPIDGLADAGDRPKGRSVTCGDHKFSKYLATFPHLQEAAD